MGCGASQPTNAEAPAEEAAAPPSATNNDDPAARQARASGGHLQHSGQCPGRKKSLSFFGFVGRV
jgi:hypothetical protein